MTSTNFFSRININSQKNGFSLYEFLIVFFIIGLLAAISIPALRNFLPGWRTTGSARALLSDLRQAQEEAVTSQKPHRINFTSTVPPVSYQLVKVDGGDQEVETVTLPIEIYLSLDTVQNPITFSIDGAPSTNGTITLKYNDGEPHKSIEISPAGVMKIP